MAVLTNLWTREQEAALPLTRHLLPLRGTFSGQCFHLTCTQTGSDWFNKLDERYYCDEHARALNEQSLRDGMPKVCALHRHL
jgi:hypothetical protein